MNTIDRALAIALSSAALLLSLVACDRTDNRSDAQHVTRKAVEATRTMGASAAVESKDAGEPAAGVAGNIHVDDALIAAKVATGLAADRDLSALHIKVDSHAGVVTLRGLAPSAAARTRAEEIARNVQGVTSVNNHLNVPAG